MARVDAIDLLSSASSSGVSAAGMSGSPVVSADGRYVAFASTAQNLTPATTNGGASLFYPHLNVFLRDRVAGTTTLISENLAGSAGGNGDSFPAGVSSNGQFVLYESWARDLTANETTNTNNVPMRDVFVRDVAGGSNILVSVGQDGLSGLGRCHSSEMTRDGRFVVFSGRLNFAASDTNNLDDVYVRDLVNHVTTEASVGSLPASSVFSQKYFSDAPDITPDGRYVAFYSTATNLVPGVATNGVFVRDLLAGTTTWASTNGRAIYVSAVGTSSAVGCNAVISADGRYVAFEVCSNTATGIGTSSRGVICRHDLQTGLTTVVNANGYVPTFVYQNIDNLDMTPDGRFITFVAGTNGGTAIFQWDAQTTNVTLVSGSLAGSVAARVLSDLPSSDVSGRYVAFISTALDLVTNTLTGATNDYRLYVHDTWSNTTWLAGQDLNVNGVIVSPTAAPQFSEDGTTLVFESDAENAVPGDNNGEPDVFVVNLPAGQTSLLSVRDAFLPSLSANGYTRNSGFGVSTNGRVAFSTGAALLPGSDTNRNPDIYLHDLVTGSNLLVSVDVSGGAGGYGASWEAAVSGDAGRVAFTSWATNLIAGDTNNTRDVFVRDIVAGTNALVSRAANGNPGNGESYTPSISLDGRYVLFWSAAGNLSSDASANAKLFLRDMIAGTNYLLTPVGSTVVAAAMTPDGQRVVFASTTSSVPSLYIWDIAAGRIYTNTVSGGNASIGQVAISIDGQTAAYVATNNLLTLNITTRSNQLIHAASSTGTGSFPASSLRFSADARYLVYVNATNAAQKNVYVHDFQTGTNTLVSAGLGVSYSNSLAMAPDISADGRFVAYCTATANGITDTNTVSDVVIYDQWSNVTAVVSLNAAGKAGNQRSSAPVFSADGKTLFFQSWASDLAAGDYNLSSDLFAVQVTPPVIVADSDHDGMDDQWELQYFHTLARDGTGDFDSDGMTDLAEFLAGTDPTDANSVLRASIVLSGATGQTPFILWPVVSNKSYAVQYKDDVTATNWQTLPGTVAITNSQGVLSDDAITNTSTRYYRILLN